MTLPCSPYLSQPALSVRSRVLMMRLQASKAKEDGDPREALRLLGLACRLEIAAPAFVAGLALRPRQRAERDFQGEHVE